MVDCGGVEDKVDLFTEVPIENQLEKLLAGFSRRFLILFHGPGAGRQSDHAYAAWRQVVLIFFVPRSDQDEGLLFGRIELV